MASFRFSGRNWEGRLWISPISIRTFGNQIDGEYSDRPKGADGTVASKAHDKVNPSSDHRPKPTRGPGTVRAIDVTVTKSLGDQITEALRTSKDRRIKYVIWNRRIFSPPDWTWRSYSGAAHDTHFHLSTIEAGDNDARLWQIGPPEPPTIEDNMLPLESTSAKEDIRSLQNRLNIAYSVGLSLDGVWGPSTIAAVKTHLSGLSGDPDANAGKRVVARQWDHLLQEMIRKTGGGGPGLSEAQVKAIVNQSRIVAPD